MFIKNRSAQSISEFAAVFVVVIAIFLAVRGFVQRGFQARYKGLMDYAQEEINTKVDEGNLANDKFQLSSVPTQYIPVYSEEAYTSSATVKSKSYCNKELEGVNYLWRRDFFEYEDEHGDPEKYYEKYNTTGYQTIKVDTE